MLLINAVIAKFAFSPVAAFPDTAIIDDRILLIFQQVHFVMPVIRESRAEGNLTIHLKRLVNNRALEPSFKVLTAMFNQRPAYDPVFLNQRADVV
jgi:hypothetical protein